MTPAERREWVETVAEVAAAVMESGHDGFHPACRLCRAVVRYEAARRGLA